MRILARALVLPIGGAAEDDQGPWGGSAKHSSREIEQIAVRVATQYETEVRGAEVRSVEADNLGFDLLSVKGLERRRIEVKGRAGVGEVAMTWSEFSKAIELGDNYWLYVVLDCASPQPRLYRVQDPARTLASHWASKLDVRYRVGPQPVIDAAEALP